MKKLIISILCISAFNVFASSNDLEVRTFIENNYINAAYNQLNVENLAIGFHEDLNMVWEDSGVLKSLSFQKWLDLIEDQKSKGIDRNYQHKFIEVKVGQKKAMAILELSQNGKIKFTDYLFLKKQNGQWKVVHKYFEK